MLEVLNPISSDSYSARPAISPGITTILPGGLPRIERDIIGGYFRFDVSLKLNKQKYVEFNNVYQQYLRAPQLVKFNLVSYGLSKPHLCYFVPGSWNMQETDARDSFRVSFSIVGSEQP